MLANFKNHTHERLFALRQVRNLLFILFCTVIITNCGGEDFESGPNEEPGISGNDGSSQDNNSDDGSDDDSTDDETTDNGSDSGGNDDETEGNDGTDTGSDDDGTGGDEGSDTGAGDDTSDDSGDGSGESSSGETSASINTITLVNTDTQVSLITLEDAALIDLGSFTSGLSIEANVEGASSVKFILSGAMSFEKVEGGAPYLLAGDFSGVYSAFEFVPGTYDLRIEAWSDANAGGELMAFTELSFDVVAAGDDGSGDDDSGGDDSGDGDSGNDGTGDDDSGDDSAGNDGSGGDDSGDDGDTVASPGSCGEEYDGTNTTVTAHLKSLTRINGVSPEGVYFSAQDSTSTNCVDLTGGSDATACASGQFLGFHFNFDDPDSGNFETTGNSKNRQISGAPRAVHVFECEGEGNSRWNSETRQCEFAVKVRVQEPAGNYDDACLRVNIKPQAEAFAAEDTYCISAENDFAECPAGVPEANKLNDTPSIGNFENSRVLFARGSVATYSSVCIDYTESNVRIGAYGSGSDPLVAGLNIGRRGSCGQTIPTIEERPNTITVDNYPRLQKDEFGHIIDGWAFDISASDLRVGSAQAGMATTLVTLHKLDMDWSETGEYDGMVKLGDDGKNCSENGNLPCEYVQYPYGLVVSEITSIANESNLPLVNFNCFTDCGIVNSAVIGSKAKRAIEHNMRVMGSWGMVVSNSWFGGDHIGGRGGKNKITLRNFKPDGQTSLNVNPEDFETGNHDSNGPGWVREPELPRQFTPHYQFMIDNIFGDTEQMPSSNEAGFMHIGAGTQYAGVFGSTFLGAPGRETNSSLFALGGRHIVTAGTNYIDNVPCRFDDSNGTNSVYTDYFLIYADTPNGACNQAGVTSIAPEPESP